MSFKRHFAEHILTLFCTFPAFYRLYIRVAQGTFNARPLLVYSAGKCGTSSLHKSLLSQNVHPSFHTHYLYPQNIDKYVNFPKHGPEAIKKAFVDHYPAVDVISLVRNPLEKFISGFFHSYFKVPRLDHELSIKHMTQQLINFYKTDDMHDWFAEELMPFSGFDIYSCDFPRDKGYATYQHGKYRFLIIKLELHNSVKEKAVESFVGINNFTYKPIGHIGQKSHYAEHYKRFKNEASLPKTFIDQFLTTKLCKTFYSDDEIQNTYSKWLK